MNNKFEQLCKENNIKADHWRNLPEFGWYADYFRQSKDAASCKSESYTAHNKVIAWNDEKQEEAKWHELGHFMHEWGGHPREAVPENLQWCRILVNELAASSWALQNYEGELPLSQLKDQYKTWFCSYLSTEGNQVEDTPEIREMADIMGVSPLLEFIKTF